jgi:branched-chain amino acid transport system substrate-binding protein
VRLPPVGWNWRNKSFQPTYLRAIVVIAEWVEARLGSAFEATLMQTTRQTRLSISLSVAALLASVPLAAQQATNSGVTDNEIRIGNIMPYTGPLAAFAVIGRAEAAYFDMVNERGGINGRKIKFVSYNDNSNPRIAVERTRDLVEKENVLFMFGSFGTPSNLATRAYLNDRKVPQLFVASGDEEWAHPKKFPWTMGWQPTFRAEGRIYANYIQAAYPDRKIAVLWENDQFGRDLFKGLQEGLGDTASMIVADTTFDASDTSVDTQIGLLRDSGAEILVFNGGPAVAARAIRGAAELDWHPLFLLDNASASIASALRPAGLQNAVGVVSTSFLKDASDAAWKEDPPIKDWSAFMDKYYPDGDKEDGYAIFGYAAAETLLQVLSQCGDDLTRENIMRQAASLRNYQGPVVLPGIAINTGPTDFHPIKQLRLVQFDGYAWQPIGDVIESAFASAPVDN